MSNPLAFTSSAKNLLKEKTLIACFFVLLLAGLFDASSVPSLLHSTFNSYFESLPFILLSIALASAIKASGAESSVSKILSDGGAVVTAAAFGALSPFCSCGVIPLIAGLLAAGAPLAPVMAFWLASPIIDPEMLILTWNMLGGQMAIAKLGSAISIGLLGGLTVMALQNRGSLLNPLRDELQAAPSDGCHSHSHDTESDRIYWAFWSEPERLRAFLLEIKTLTLFLTKWLLLAFLLEAVMLRWVPLESLVSNFNNMGYASIPLAAAVGVPAYLNGYAAIPLMRGLLDSGLQPGAALSFMVAGGVTCIPAVIGVWGLVRPSTFAIYLSMAASGSIAVGLVFQLLSGQ